MCAAPHEGLVSEQINMTEQEKTNSVDRCAVTENGDHGPVERPPA